MWNHIISVILILFTGTYQIIAISYIVRSNLVQQVNFNFIATVAVTDVIQIKRFVTVL